MSQGNSIQFSPLTSILDNGAAGTLVAGKSGSGKTFFLLKICSDILTFSIRLMGIDPKNDLIQLKSVFPEINVIDVNDIQPGALNPFMVLDDLDISSLLGLISIMCGGLTDKQSNVLMPIVSDFLTRQRRFNAHINFSDLANYLYAKDDEDAQTIGTKLLVCKESKYGGLVFGDTVETQKIENESTIFSFKGMPLPKVGAKHVTDNEKFNSSIIYIVCRMINNFLSKGDKYPTAVVMDEMHIAMATDEFRQVIDNLLVLGRSDAIATVLASQNITHFPEDMVNHMASKFCLKEDRTQATKFLELFEESDNNDQADFDSIINMITNFDPGQAYYIDSKNRSGSFKISSDLGITSNPIESLKRKASK